MLLEVTLFSNGAIIDRTGYGLSVKASRKRFNYVERSTASRCSLDEGIRQCGEQWLESYRAVDGAGTSPTTPLKLSKFSVLSRRPYNIVHIAPGTNVYSDRDIKFLHVPGFLRDALYIQSPCNDHASKVSNLLELQANKTCVLLLLFEASSVADVKNLPVWIQYSGFHRLMHTAIGRRTTSAGINVDHHFIIFGKIVETSFVTLGGMVLTHSLTLTHSYSHTLTYLLTLGVGVTGRLQLLGCPRRHGKLVHE